MELDSDQQKLIEHLQQIEEVGELIVAKQTQIVDCDRNRQHTREACRLLGRSTKGESSSSSNTWIMLSNQFFQFPTTNIQCALNEDMRTYDLEIEKLRNELKEDVNQLNELEGKEKLQGFDLVAMSKTDVPNH